MDISVAWLNNLARNGEHKGAGRYGTRLAELSRQLAEKGIAWSEPPPVPPYPIPYAGTISPGWEFRLARAMYYEPGEDGLAPYDDIAERRRSREIEEASDAALDAGSHLLFVLACKGTAVCVPVDFPEPVRCRSPWDTFVGSSQALVRQLARGAPKIGIGLGPDGSVDAAQERTLATLDHGDPFSVEKFTWNALYAAGRASAATGHAILIS